VGATAEQIAVIYESSSMHHLQMLLSHQKHAIPSTDAVQNNHGASVKG
jgi:hypothetical protein